MSHGTQSICVVITAVDYTFILNTNICVMLLLKLATNMDLSRSLVHVYNILNIHVMLSACFMATTVYILTVTNALFS